VYHYSIVAVINAFHNELTGLRNSTIYVCSVLERTIWSKESSKLGICYSIEYWTASDLKSTASNYSSCSISMWNQMNIRRMYLLVTHWLQELVVNLEQPCVFDGCKWRRN